MCRKIRATPRRELVPFTGNDGVITRILLVPGAAPNFCPGVIKVWIGGAWARRGRDSDARKDDTLVRLAVGRLSH
jgi:hypothetical protein